MKTQTETVNNTADSKPQRLLSIDALRGFDMLLISGGGTFLVLLENQTGLAWVDWIANQLKHPAWNGFTFYDFIFPLFLFIAGVSMAFSLNKGIEMGLSKAELYKKAFWRMLILVILGILDKNQPVTFFDPSQIRVASVLGRIGVAGFFASLLYLNFSRLHRIFWVAGILLL
jgi:predicted acyltransferase